MGMVVRKIVINLLAACLLPLIFIFTDLYEAVTSPHRYQPDEFKIGMLVEYFYERHWDMFIRIAVFSLALIFLPFQLIKKSLPRKRKQNSFFFQKVGRIKYNYCNLVLSWCCYLGFLGLPLVYYPFFYCLAFFTRFSFCNIFPLHIGSL